MAAARDWPVVDFGGAAAEPARAAELARLWQAAWTRTMPAIDFGARLDWLAAHLAAALADGARLRVALHAEAGAAVGFVLVDPARRYLDQIAVHPDHWGAGVAEVLLAEARRLSPGGLSLDVNADNPRALAFYRRAGFLAVGEGINARSGLATLALEWRPGAC